MVIEGREKAAARRDSACLPGWDIMAVMIVCPWANPPVYLPKCWVTFKPDYSIQALCRGVWWDPNDWRLVKNA